MTPLPVSRCPRRCSTDLLKPRGNHQVQRDRKALKEAPDPTHEGIIMYLHIHIHTHTCIHTNIYTYNCVCVCSSVVCLSVCMYVCMYFSVCVYMIFLYVYVYTCTRVYIYIIIHTYILHFTSALQSLQVSASDVGDRLTWPGL